MGERNFEVEGLFIVEYKPNLNKRKTKWFIV